jgi:hypothetical protein
MRRRFVAVHESAFGTKETSKSHPAMSAFGGEAGIGQAQWGFANFVRKSSIIFGLAPARVSGRELSARPGA